MYSQCPECHARFRVTAEALRAARGTVRCGRCGSAFDALARLSDTLPPARPAESERPSADAATMLGALPGTGTAAEYHFTADDLEKVFIDAREWQQQFGPEPGSNDAVAPAAQAVEPSVVLVDESEPLEDITLEGERISIETPPGLDVGDLESTDEFRVLRNVPEAAYPDDEDTGEFPPLAAPEPEPAVQAAATATAPETTPSAPTARTLAEQRWHRTDEARPAALVEDGAVAERSGWRTVAWSLACLLCAVGLLAQVTHYYRQDLVRHPRLGPVLREAYARIGLPLSPNWDLEAFEIRQWGNAEGADASGRMSIRASLTNRASFAQPHPVLRLQLEDRFGEAIAVRDFAPAEYLKNLDEASRLLAPAASAEADLEIVDPGQAVGYRLDVCLRESATLLRCAQGGG